jgi:hypothetical protein
VCVCVCCLSPVIIVMEAPFPSELLHELSLKAFQVHNSSDYIVLN